MQGGSVVACTMRKRGGEAEPLLKSVKVPPVRVVWWRNGQRGDVSGRAEPPTLVARCRPGGRATADWHWARSVDWTGDLRGEGPPSVLSSLCDVCGLFIFIHSRECCGLCFQGLSEFLW